MYVQRTVRNIKPIERGLDSLDLQVLILELVGQRLVRLVLCIRRLRERYQKTGQDIRFPIVPGLLW